MKFNLHEMLGLEAQQVKEIFQALYWLVSHIPEIACVIGFCLVAHYALALKNAFRK